MLVLVTRELDDRGLYVWFLCFRVGGLGVRMDSCEAGELLHWFTSGRNVPSHVQSWRPRCKPLLLANVGPLTCSDPGTLCIPDEVREDPVCLLQESEVKTDRPVKVNGSAQMLFLNWGLDVQSGPVRRCELSREKQCTRFLTQASQG